MTSSTEPGTASADATAVRQLAEAVLGADATPVTAAILIRIEALRQTHCYNLPPAVLFDGEDDEALGRYTTSQNGPRSATEAARLNQRLAQLEAAEIARTLRMAARFAEYLATGDLLGEAATDAWALSLGDHGDGGSASTGT